MYSTCSLNPIENEAVIGTALSLCKGKLGCGQSQAALLQPLSAEEIGAALILQSQKLGEGGRGGREGGKGGREGGRDFPFLCFISHIENSS